jgi:acyl-CoA synthetase (AMP-forming)/AMP-acid ligase II
VPHEVLGEDIAAAVTLRPGQSATPEDIIAFCRQHLADNKVPRTLLILETMPLNPNGKILKKDLAPVLEQAAKEARVKRTA